MRLSLICLATLAANIMLPAESSAKFALITRGDAFSHLGEISSKNLPANGKMPLKNLSVGYKYSYFGVFWVDIWRYDGEYCVYHDMEYNSITKEEAAALMGVPESSIGEPFWYKVPPGLIVLGVIGVFAVIGVISKQKQKQKVMALVGDPRYQLALDIFRQQVDENETAKKTATEKGEPEPENQPDPWQAAISNLVASGVDKAEAEAEFGKVLAYALERANEQTT